MILHSKYDLVAVCDGDTGNFPVFRWQNTSFLHQALFEHFKPTPIRKVKGGIEEMLPTPIEDKLKDNTTSINTTSNNRDGKPSSLTIVEDYFRLKNCL